MKKLEAKGFEDIENTTSSFVPLKQYHSAYFQSRYSPDEFLENQDFYSMGEQFLKEYKFKNKVHKLIWSLYVGGMTRVEIAKKLEDAGKTPCKKSQVSEIVSKLTKEMLKKEIVKNGKST